MDQLTLTPQLPPLRPPYFRREVLLNGNEYWRLVIARPQDVLTLPFTIDSIDWENHEVVRLKLNTALAWAQRFMQVEADNAE